MDLKVLLIDADPDDTRYLHDVLSEIEDEHYLAEWPAIDVWHVATWAEAERCLSSGTPHLVLLDCELPDRGAADAFCRCQSLAPDVPVIVLADPQDQDLARKLMLEGAEDYLCGKKIDCAPLAHAMRTAIFRRRVGAAARASMQFDPLTGLLNRTGFMALADRDRKLAERLERRWMLLIAEPKDPLLGLDSSGEHRLDLHMVAAADHLRSLAGPTDLVARIGRSRFAMGIFDTEIETLEEAWIRVRSAAAERRFEIGASIFDSARPLSLEAMLIQAARDLLPSSVEALHAAQGGAK
jgi:DNA-binding NarL/FixJ family response regulator